jgi:hypothetical protein
MTEMVPQGRRVEPGEVGAAGCRGIASTVLLGGGMSTVSSTLVCKSALAVLMGRTPDDVEIDGDLMRLRFARPLPYDRSGMLGLLAHLDRGSSRRPSSGVSLTWRRYLD